MTLIQRYVAAMDRVSVFTGKACGILYLTCVVLSVFEVVMRYVFESPTQWSFEIVMALCATAWLLCIGWVTEQNRHITVTVLELWVPKRIWETLRTIAIAISVIATTLLIWTCWEPGVSALESMERTGSSFNPPLPALLKPLLIGSATLYTLQLIANLLRRLTEPDR